MLTVIIAQPASGSGVPMSNPVLAAMQPLRAQAVLSEFFLHLQTPKEPTQPSYMSCSWHHHLFLRFCLVGLWGGRREGGVGRGLIVASSWGLSCLFYKVEEGVALDCARGPFQFSHAVVLNSFSWLSSGNPSAVDQAWGWGSSQSKRVCSHGRGGGAAPALLLSQLLFHKSWSCRQGLWSSWRLRLCSWLWALACQGPLRLASLRRVREALSPTSGDFSAAA